MSSAENVLTKVDGQALTEPYPGLRPFRESDALVFFGREDLIEDIVERLQRNRFVAMVGESGTGKSSLVFAGLLPALKAGWILEQGTDWLQISMQPGRNPITSAATMILNEPTAREVLGVLPEGMESDIQDSLASRIGTNPFALSDILDQTSKQSGRPVLLIVDQFEEIFRYIPRPDPRAPLKFVANLLQLLNSKSEGVYVVLTMRSDYLGECARFPGLAEALTKSQFLTPRLKRSQQEDAITKPLMRFGATIEPRLVSILLNEAVRSGKENLDPADEGRDKLPLLQHALHQLWRNYTDAQTDLLQGERLLTYEQLEKLGLEDPKSKIAAHRKTEEPTSILQRVLDNHLEKCLDGLKELDPDLKITERLFKSLTNRDRGRNDSRRDVSAEQVSKILQLPVSQVLAVADYFRADGRNFLQPDSRECRQLEALTAIDLVHESLIRRWCRLEEWAAQELDDISEYRRLVANSKKWDDLAGRKKRESLLGVSLTKQYAGWLGNQEPNLAWVELQYELPSTTDTAQQKQPESKESLEMREDFGRAISYIKASKEELDRRSKMGKVLTFVVVAFLSLLILLAPISFALSAATKALDTQNAKLTKTTGELSQAKISLKSTNAAAALADTARLSAIKAQSIADVKVKSLNKRLLEIQKDKVKIDAALITANRRLDEAVKSKKLADAAVARAKLAEATMTTLAVTAQMALAESKKQLIAANADLQTAKNEVIKLTSINSQLTIYNTQLASTKLQLEADIQALNLKTNQFSQSTLELQKAKVFIRSTIEFLKRDPERNAALISSLQLSLDKASTTTSLSKRFEVTLRGSDGVATLIDKSNPNSMPIQLKDSISASYASFSPDEHFIVVSMDPLGVINGETPAKAVLVSQIRIYDITSIAKKDNISSISQLSLDGIVSQVRVSKNNQVVAALSESFEVVAWALKTGIVLGSTKSKANPYNFISFQDDEGTKMSLTTSSGQFETWATGQKSSVTNPPITGPAVEISARVWPNEEYERKLGSKLQDKFSVVEVIVKNNSPTDRIKFAGNSVWLIASPTKDPGLIGMTPPDPSQFVNYTKVHGGNPPKPGLTIVPTLFADLPKALLDKLPTKAQAFLRVAALAKDESIGPGQSIVRDVLIPESVLKRIRTNLNPNIAPDITGYYMVSPKG